jgi:hypothetical protein
MPLALPFPSKNLTLDEPRLIARAMVLSFCYVLWYFRSVNVIYRIAT